MELKVTKYILLTFLIFTLHGCIYRVISDYEDCVSENLTFEFKDNIKLYIVDDSNARYKYSSMNFPKGEHYLYLCSDEEDECLNEFSGPYYRGWKLIRVESKPFHLTGRYKIDKPNLILGAFAPETSALQIKMGDITAWVSVYVFDMDYMKESSASSVEELNKNRKPRTDWNNRMTKFECPNSDAKESSWEVFWSY